MVDWFTNEKLWRGLKPVRPYSAIPQFPCWHGDMTQFISSGTAINNVVACYTCPAGSYAFITLITVNHYNAGAAAWGCGLQLFDDTPAFVSWLHYHVGLVGASDSFTIAPTHPIILQPGESIRASSGIANYYVLGVIMGFKITDDYVNWP